MRMRVASLSVVFFLAFAAGALHGCGGSSGAKPTPKCVLPSDCSGTLVCALGYCVNPCNESKDCPSGQLCVKVGTDNACRAPEVASMNCAQNSECKTPLVCGRDLTCRQECVEDVDCPGGGKAGGQKCTESHTCADPKLDTNYDPITNDFRPPTTGTAGTTGVAGSGGAGTTGAAGSNDAAAGTTGAAGTGTDGGAGTGAAGSDPDGAAGSAAGSPADGGNKDTAFMPMTVMVMPSDKLFQGQLGPLSATVTITNTAGGLSNPSVVDFGGLQAFVTAASSNDTTLVLRVSVPHGTAIGKKTLKLSTVGGLITYADLVEVTAIYAGPDGMDTNVGSSASPFKTLKQALTVASSGDTIHLLDGMYQVTTGGETFGYLLPANITIVGDSTAGTILDGTSAQNGTDGFDASTALTLQDLTIKGFTNGIDIKMPNSTVTLKDVAITGNKSNAILFESLAANSTVNFSGANGTIFQPGAVFGVQFNSVTNATFNMTDGSATAGSHVFYFYGACPGSKLSLTNTKVTQAATSSSSYAVYVYPSGGGVSLNLDKVTVAGTVSQNDTAGTLTITGSTFNQAYGAGDAIQFHGKTLSITGASKINFMDSASAQVNSGTGVEYQTSAGSTSTVTIDGLTITGGYYGITQNAPGGKVKLRNTTVTKQYYHGYTITNGSVDMGTMTDPGLNSLALPSQPSNYYYYALHVNGAAGAGVTVTSSQTTIGGGDPGAQAQPIVIAPAGTTATTLGNRYYVSPGSTLTLY